MSTKPTQRICTVLFADMTDSSGLYDRLGDDAANEVVRACLSLMQEVVTSLGGTVEEEVGDEILCFFDDPDAAAQAACQIQQRVSSGFELGELPEPVRVQVGFAHGPQPVGGNMKTGATLITAARLVSRAKTEQILTTRETLDALSAPEEYSTRFYDRLVLQGQAGERDVYEILWSAGATIVGKTVTTLKRRRATRAVFLTWEDETWRVDRDAPSLDIGRDPRCRIQVVGDSVSRLHARVHWSRGKVRVEDVSANGTVVEPKHGEVVRIKHESLTLRDSGVLRLGIPGEGGGAAEVPYRCELEPA
ncbi:MAG: FHA domain-containing protein [Planctomycetota bacterium]|jgi:class 3 adenylate cyclase